MIIFTLYSSIPYQIGDNFWNRNTVLNDDRLKMINIVLIPKYQVRHFSNTHTFINGTKETRQRLHTD